MDRGNLFIEYEYERDPNSNRKEREDRVERILSINPILFFSHWRKRINSKKGTREFTREKTI